MKKLFFAALVPLLIVGVLSAQGDSRAVGGVETFMQAKLEHSKKLLEALVLENYDAIGKHSRQLGMLSRAAQWQVIQTPDYVQHSEEFRRTTEALGGAGKDKNLDGAALAFVAMTLKCVDCHKYVRRVRMAGLDAPSDRLLTYQKMTEVPR